ncbi:MAG: hypothetical protein ACHQ2Z_11875, partial [Elusimicrobiota bacterium]
MRNALVLSFLALPLLSRAAADLDAEAKAQAIALAQPRVRSQYDALKKEEGLIKDPVRRKELADLLDRPVFRVLER